jgi:hypothetical protein
MAKKSLVAFTKFYISYHEAMEDLSDEQYGRVSRAINDYALYGKEAELIGVESIIFKMARPTIDSSVNGRINGKKGGAPKGNHNAGRKQSENNPPCFDKTTNDNDNVNEKDNDKNKDGASAPDDDFSEPLSESQKSALELSELLLSAHRKEMPDYLSGRKDANIIQRWAVDVEKLIRIDKKSPDKIRQVILWAKTPGNFWFVNVQSGEKLRKHFERISGQMQMDGGKRAGTGPPPHRIAADNIPPGDLDQYFS